MNAYEITALVLTAIGPYLAYRKCKCSRSNKTRMVMESANMQQNLQKKVGSSHD